MTDLLPSETVVELQLRLVGVLWLVPDWLLAAGWAGRRWLPLSHIVYLDLQCNDQRQTIVNNTSSVHLIHCCSRACLTERIMGHGLCLAVFTHVVL